MTAENGDHTHYEATKEVFRFSALHKRGYYDARLGQRLTHSVWQRHVRRSVISILDEVLARDPDVTRIVDVGCGRGDFTLEVATRYPQLREAWGCDFCAEALAIGRAEGRAPTRVVFQEADVLRLPFENNRFDATVCINVLHHICAKDLATALGELARITRKYLILELKNRRSLYYRWVRHRTVPPVGRIRIYPTSVSTLTSMLARWGFAMTEVRNLFGWSWLSPLVVVRYDKHA